MEIEACKTVIHGKLTPQRYAHSIAVSQQARLLALAWGAQTERATQAGLLHDITKDYTREQHLEIFEKYHIALSDVERFSPKLWHAISGRALLENELGIDDAEILDAVRYHTTARAGMSLLEKVIYLADFISADRNFEGVAQLRESVAQSLDRGFLAALDFSISELVAKGSTVHIDTVNARNEFLCANIKV
ncbi:MAG: bis(5'-nucleosyl)-tetraphosphatase (symmetrical) YqeK [Clostridia bacterium]|nr:bis(5'-nucleosyl)-tetraphosphatase (symmetrical) YqeK [Clostridia bacterium]MDR3645804.1 bis(5'-nucleosyl)-tetraphosphatase (symmetrical) YqeK [Clostridia bacterium]